MTWKELVIPIAVGVSIGTISAVLTAMTVISTGAICP